MKRAELTELRRRLSGSITTDSTVRSHYATDGSIFTQTPAVVVYPHDRSDIAALMCYLYERAAAGKDVPGVTARGRGSDLTGAALSDGVALILPARLNRLISLDKSTVTIQPGMNYGQLESVLHSHGRCLPPYPSSADFSTLGGAVANNAAGEKSVKYGSIRRYVKRLQVVLADGSTIETRRLSARELNRKKGQTDLEGEIYRRVDGLLLDNVKLLERSTPKTTKNAAGYDLWDVRRRDGSFDLGQLVIGSQGTLGIVTELTLQTVPYNPRTTLVAAYFDDLTKAGEAIRRIGRLSPSALELIDDNVIRLVESSRPALLEKLIPDVRPRLIVLAEFDDRSQLQQTMRARRAMRIGESLGSGARLTAEPAEQERLWRLRHAAAAVMSMAIGKTKALPFIEDAAVPPAKLPQLLERTYKLLRQHGVEAAVWGHAGDANLHLQPFLDLAKPKSAAKLDELADDFAEIVLGLGGTLSAEHGDGLVRGPYLKRQFGPELYVLFEAVKAAFDPYSLLNPGKKLGVEQSTARALRRREYSLPQLFDHLPH